MSVYTFTKTEAFLSVLVQKRSNVNGALDKFQFFTFGDLEREPYHLFICEVNYFNFLSGFLLFLEGSCSK